MRVKNAFLILIFLALPVLACISGGRDGPPSDAIIIETMANTSLTPWLRDTVAGFNNSKTKTSDGKPVFVALNPVEAGQAAVDIRDGVSAPALWIPDNEVWVNVLARQGNAGFQSDCVSVAQSPLVIAMWRPIAESLGWPGRSLGWLDIGSLAADPSAWAYYSGGQFGDTLRMGHTHPGLSGSGTNTLLAIVQAAESKVAAVTVEDIRQPIVQASVGAFEGTVSWFSPAVDSLAQTMRHRGSSYLGAAVMYESDVININTSAADIVPIYPFEGTFMATHPACINASAGSAEQEAATLFRNYLLSEAGQDLAVANGLRPVNPTTPIAAPLDAAHAIDLSQPKVVFGSPSVETLYAAQEMWQTARKDVNLVMLLDVSGSMRGDKIDNMKWAAAQFVAQMGDDDQLSLIAFFTAPVILMSHAPVEQARQEAIDAIERLEAGGDTSLYDAIGMGSEIIANSTSPKTANVLVVLTDGKDTASWEHAFDQRLIEAAAANDTTVFTIAYGRDADEGVLSELANRANGNFYRGNEANIAAIYQEMSAAFGGSVGIGR